MPSTRKKTPPTPLGHEAPSLPHQQSVHARLDAADASDATARARDRAALVRDEAADAVLRPESGALNAADRQAAAADREHAARDRWHAFVDREALAHQVAIAATDPFARARGLGAQLTDLDAERVRRRRGGPVNGPTPSR